MLSSGAGYVCDSLCAAIEFGHDAILLAAATGARGGEHAIDLGAGVGAAGLALAARVVDLKVTLVEVDPVLCSLAAYNARLIVFDV